MKYCNIVFETELVNHKRLEYIKYFNYSINYNEIDNNLPTLYVGWLFLKKCNIFNADILTNAIIENKLYWIPSFEENKTSHINGVNSFVTLAPTIYLKNNYVYTDIDPVISQLYTIQDIINCIGTNFDKSYQYKSDMIYLLRDNTIYGLNLKMFEFFDFNIIDLLKSLYSNISNPIVDNNGDIFVDYFKKLSYFKFLKRFIVVIVEN